MNDRSAVDTIKGYFYQFDLTILKLLQLEKEADEITVEGIEDIDIINATEETAIQCKYHAKTEYNHSVIAKPIRLMLNHFKSGILCGSQKRVKYSYFGHFKSGHEKLTLPITVDFIKGHLLTYTKDKVEHRLYDELNLNDTELTEFLEVLEIDINAKSYEDQLAEIYKLLKAKEAFDCDDFDAENFYYNNALKIVSNLAKEGDISNRRKSKKKFLQEINSKEVLFHKWFLQYKGKKQILANLRSKYFTHYNISPFERFFLVEVNQSTYSKSELKDIIHLISKKWGDIKSAKNPDTFCPYICITGIIQEQLIELKSELLSEGFKFKDGFDFSGASFNPKSIIEKATFHNQTKIKIVNDLNQLSSVLTEITKTKEVYQFYINTPYFQTPNESVKNVLIQTEEINDIKNII